MKISIFDYFLFNDLLCSICNNNKSTLIKSIILYWEYFNKFAKISAFLRCFICSAIFLAHSYQYVLFLVYVFAVKVYPTNLLLDNVKIALIKTHSNNVYEQFQCFNAMVEVPYFVTHWFIVELLKLIIIYSIWINILFLPLFKLKPI